MNLTQARADLDIIAHELTRKYPASNTGRTINALTLLDAGVGDYRGNLNLLLVAVACVLLIACANVANLQLARALSRGKELAVRAAMGASRWRLMRLLLIESAVLGLVGGAFGLLVAVWSLDVIHSLSPPQSLRFQETRIDLVTLAFAMTIALLCGIVVGVWPAWRVSRLASLSGVLHEAGTRSGSDSTSRQRARGALVVTQVALALVLLAGAGLTLKSFWNSQNAALGFDPDDILTMTLSLPKARYDSDDKVTNFNRRLIAQIEALPGVAAAAIGENVPFDGTEWDSSFHITGTPPVQPGKEPSAEVNVISPRLFQGPENANPARALLWPGGTAEATALGHHRRQFCDPLFPESKSDRPAHRRQPDERSQSAASHDRRRRAAGPLGRPGRGVRPAASAADVFLRGAVGDLRKQPARPGEKRRPSTRSRAPVVREVQNIDPDQPVAEISTMKKQYFRKPGDPTPNDDACLAPLRRSPSSWRASGSMA